MSVLLCEVLKKSFPTLEAAAITAGSLGSCLPPVIGPRKGSLMEARRPERTVVESAQNKGADGLGQADEREGWTGWLMVGLWGQEPRDSSAGLLVSPRLRSSDHRTSRRHWVPPTPSQLCCFLLNPLPGSENSKYKGPGVGQNPFS